MRLFLATNFPAAVLRDLNDRVAAIRPRLPSASWVREETQHLTLAFLGEQPESTPDAITPALTKALAEISAFEARLQGCGFFPNPRRARVGWIGLNPNDRYVATATAVRNAVEQHGITLDAAEFKPHLTLMRMRDPWPPASIELFTRSLRDYVSRPFAVGTVTLFSSQLHPNGAIHTALQSFALQDEA
jgi:2'-5' RNA ligase